MKCVGIIAEYNPFHNGHAYHIEAAKRLSGAEHAVVVMSGSFVQRGAPACLDKFTRARLAGQNGADLVIELPDALSCACAERFAAGGVRLIKATGIVGSIAFGSECGDIGAIRSAADKELSPALLREYLSEGLSYPKALSLCMNEEAKLTGNGLAEPNDLLAVEYVRQINAIAPSIEPIAIKRVGSDHSLTELNGEYASASAIRAACERGETESIAGCVPGSVFTELLSAEQRGVFPAMLGRLSQAILYALRCMDKEQIAALADVSEGLENPIQRKALEASSADELLSMLKSKRYTMARLRRILINSILGTTEDLQKRAANEEKGLYIRVLYVSAGRGGELLSALCANAELPVIVKGRDVRKLTGTAKEVFEHSSRAAAVRSLACPGVTAADGDFIRLARE